MTIDKLTLNVGVRYDYQWGENAPGNVPLGDYDPAVWPQVPLTALDMPGTRSAHLEGLVAARRDDVRARDRQQDDRSGELRALRQPDGGNSANVTSQRRLRRSLPTSTTSGHDANGNHRVDPGEVNFTGGPIAYYNWDPEQPELRHAVDQQARLRHEDPPDRTSSSSASSMS